MVEPVKKVRKAREKKVKIIDDVAPKQIPYKQYKDSDEYRYMKTQIDTIADYMKTNTIKEKRNEVIKEKPIEPPKVSNLTAVEVVKVQKPVAPLIPSFSTLRNKKRKNKVGF